MTHSAQHEPTNADLWAQPPANAAPTYPGQQVAPVPHPAPSPAYIEAPKPDRTQFVLAIVSLGIGIPLTGIASGMGLVGFLIAWVGIVMVNVVYGWTRRPH